ncbi:MAG: outer membrane lipoprotein-sorting protein [Bryobacteraceae bacterium]
MNKTLLWMIAGACAAEDAREIVAEAQRRTRTDSQHYEGSLQVIDARNRVTAKKWIYDRIGSHGRSKAVLRFTEPPEVKGVAILIVNHPDRASDQWMWTPAIQRERRIALQDRSTRFFGTGFSFEDLEERDVDQYDYRLPGEEAQGGEACWKIESRPRPGRQSQYSHTQAWIRKDVLVTVRIDAFRKDELVRRITWRDIEKIKGIWTAKTMEVFDARRNSRTVMRLERLDYNLPMKDSDFTLEALRLGRAPAAGSR